jgi:hypothetical protein
MEETMNTSNRKWTWVAGVIAAVLYFGPQAVESFRQAALYRQRSQAMNARPENARIAVPASVQAQPTAVSTPTPASVNPAANSIVGIWQGQQVQANHEVCQLALEVRESTVGLLTGFAKLTCWPLVPNVAGQRRGNQVTNVVRSLSPAPAVLTGRMQNGTAVFDVEKTFGATVEGCALTGFSVTPFGTDQIAAEWQNGDCGKGQMVARRQGR